MDLSGGQREIVVEDIAGGGWDLQRQRDREREDLGLGFEEFSFNLKKKKKSNPANVFDLISIHMIIIFIQLKLINYFFLFRADVAFFNAKKHFLLLIQAT